MSDESKLTESRAMVERSFKDIETGRTQLAKQAIEEIAEELGLKLERRPARRNNFNSRGDGYTPDIDPD